jgi:coatomer protein complex subunit alpha (xenin)
LDREGRIKTLFVDSTEFSFKMALHKKDFASVKRIVQSSRLSGHAIIGYLQKKGYVT